MWKAIAICGVWIGAGILGFKYEGAWLVALMACIATYGIVTYFDNLTPERKGR